MSTVWTLDSASQKELELRQAGFFLYHYGETGEFCWKKKESDFLPRFADRDGCTNYAHRITLKKQ